MAQRTFLQSVVLAGLLTAAFTALPKGSSHPPAESPNTAGNRVSFDELPRARLFSSSRHTQSLEGYIMVCPVYDRFGLPTKYGSRQDIACHDKNGDSAWITAEASAPSGFVLDSYSYTFHGVEGHHPVLVLYYRRAAR